MPSTSDGPDLINSLPDECLVSILSRVGFETLPRRETCSAVLHPIHCTLVCRRWSSLADRAVLHLHFSTRHSSRARHNSTAINSISSNPPAASLRQSLARFPSLRSLSFVHFEPDDLSSVLRALGFGACPLLDTLEYHTPKLYPFQSDVDGLDWAGALRRCHLIRHLTIRSRQLVPHQEKLNLAIRALPSLESLDVMPMDPLQDEAENAGAEDGVQGLGGLKSLGLQYVSQRRPLAASIGSLPLLETLILSYCLYTEIPDSLGKLGNLRSLELIYLVNLNALPESLGELRRLERLKVACSMLLEGLPKSIGQLAALRTLSVQRCGGLRRLPVSLGQLVGLEELVLVGLDALAVRDEGAEGLLEALCTMSALKELTADRALIASWPEALRSLRSLTRLSLCGSIEDRERGSGTGDLVRVVLREAANLPCLTITSLESPISIL